MSENEMRLFRDLQQRVYRLVEFVDEGYHKSYEGAIDVTLCFPSIYTRDEEPDCRITLHSYLLIAGRHMDFYSQSFGGALRQLEKWVKEKEERYGIETRKRRDV